MNLKGRKDKGKHGYGGKHNRAHDFSHPGDIDKGQHTEYQKRERFPR